MRLRIFSFAALLFAALFALPLHLRVTNSASVELLDILQDTRAVAFDVLTFVVAAIAILYLIKNNAYRVTALMTFGFGFLMIANAEYIFVFDRALEFSQASYVLDPTFFVGSVLKMSNPRSFFAYIVVAIAVYFIARNITFPHQTKILVAFGVIAAPLLLIPANPDILAWRQNGFVQQTASNLWSFATNSKKALVATKPSETAISEVEAELRFELEASENPIRLAEKPNILLIVLESVSGAYLPSNAEEHGVESQVKMPNLDKFLSRGLSFSRFIAHQRQTTRGTYALLCADLPRFSTSMPKLELAAVNKTKLNCLPQMLKDVGYSTNYLQAAPLSFSRKDQALPLMGYDSYKGAEWFGSELVGTGWGVDDDVLFNTAFDEIQHLRKNAKPWLLTLLNVGTHHPFDQVPQDFVGSGNPKVRSFEYLDHVLGNFFARLENAGQLNDTLVIVTSDESGGLTGRGKGVLQEIARNWIVMGWVHPQLPNSRNNQYFAQIDLVPSLIDALGLPAIDGLKGQSFLRESDENRRLYAYHNHGDLLFEFQNRSATICSRQSAFCRLYELENGKFGEANLKREFSELPERLNAAAHISNLGPDELIVQLLPKNTAVKIDEPGYAFCCQYLKAGLGSKLELDLDLEIETAGRIEVNVEISSRKEGVFTNHYSIRLRLEGSGRIELADAVELLEYRDEIEVRLHFSAPATINVNRARLTIHSIK